MCKNSTGNNGTIKSSKIQFLDGATPSQKSPTPPFSDKIYYLLPIPYRFHSTHACAGKNNQELPYGAQKLSNNLLKHRPPLDLTRYFPYKTTHPNPTTPEIRQIRKIRKKRQNRTGQRRSKSTETKKNTHGQQLTQRFSS